MTITEMINLGLAIVAGLVVLVGGIGYVIHLFTKSTRDEKSEVMSSATQMTDFWQKQAEGYQKIMAEKDKSNDEKFQTMTKELGEIRGKLQAREEQIKEYIAIFQNRDPETKKFMDIMLEFVRNQTETNKEVARILGEIHKMETDEHDKEFKVEATVTKT